MDLALKAQWEQSEGLLSLGLVDWWALPGQVQRSGGVGFRVGHSSQEQAFPKRHASVEEAFHI